MELQELIAKNPKVGQYLQENNCYFGINTPIPNACLRKLKDNEVTITEDVFEKMYLLAEKTQQTGCEHSFLLFCDNKDVEGNHCLLNNFATQEKNPHRRVAKYGKELLSVIDRLEKLVDSGRFKGVTVFIGHTHPAEGSWYDNFSLGDLIGCSEGVKSSSSDVYATRKIETANCMLTADGKIRMVFYDPNVKNFFVFDNINVRKKDGTKVEFEDYFKRYEEKQINKKELLTSLYGLSKNEIIQDDLSIPKKHK